jgi:hypothetical protein
LKPYEDCDCYRYWEKPFKWNNKHCEIGSTKTTTITKWPCLPNLAIRRFMATSAWRHKSFAPIRMRVQIHLPLAPHYGPMTGSSIQLGPIGLMTIFPNGIESETRLFCL